MVVYILTFIVFAAILLFSYRALGGEPASGEEVDKFFDNVVEWVRTDAQTIAVIKDGAVIDDSVVEQAREVRKKVAGYQQQIARLDSGEDEGEDRKQRAALVAAIESLGWACRMIETGGYQANEGVREAAASLYRSAIKSLAGI